MQAERIITNFRILFFTMGTITVIVNIILIALIIWRSPRIFAAYKWLLLNVSITELIMSVLLEHFLRQFPLAPETIFMVDGPAKYLEIKFLKFEVAMTFGLLAFCFATQMICSFYRYLTLARKAVLKFYSHLQWTLAIVLFEMVGFALNFISIYVVTDTDQSKLIARSPSQYLDYFNQQIKNQEKLPLFFSFGTNTELGPEKRLAVLLPVTLIGLALATLILAFLTVKALQVQRATMTQSTYKMHLRFVIVLVIEVLYPVLMFTVPLLVAMINIKFGILSHSESMAEIYPLVILGLVQSYPIAHALTTICFIAPYRKAVINCFYKVIGKTKVSVIGAGHSSSIPRSSIV